MMTMMMTLIMTMMMTMMMMTMMMMTMIGGQGTQLCAAVYALIAPGNVTLPTKLAKLSHNL